MTSQIWRHKIAQHLEELFLCTLECLRHRSRSRTGGWKREAKGGLWKFKLTSVRVFMFFSSYHSHSGSEVEVLEIWVSSKLPYWRYKLLQIYGKDLPEDKSNREESRSEREKVLRTYLESLDSAWISLFIKPVRVFYLKLIRSDQISRSVMSDSLQPHESQHARPPCPSPAPGVHSDPRPLSQWCHPAISSSVVPFSSCPQSLPASDKGCCFFHHTKK